MKDRKDFTEPDYCLKPDFFKFVTMVNRHSKLLLEAYAIDFPEAYMEWCEEISRDILPGCRDMNDETSGPDEIDCSEVCTGAICARSSMIMD